MVKRALQAWLSLWVLALGSAGFAVLADRVPPAGTADAAGYGRPAVGRPVTIDDLARLGDIGEGALSARDSPPLAISHDGKRIAFQLRRADPATNSYRLSIVVVDLRHPEVPLTIDEGGEFLRVLMRNRSLSAFATGAPRVIVPAWSPDDAWVAYLRRERGVTRLWRARSDGSGAEPVTGAAVDVEAFRWSDDGTALLYSRPAIDEKREAIEREGYTGFHYDDRFWPMASARPFATGVHHAIWSSVALAGKVVTAAAMQSRAAPEDRPTDVPAEALDIARAPHGDGLAWTEKISPDTIKSDVVLHARLGGRDRRCGAAACTSGFLRAWWRTAADLSFLRAEGIGGRSQLALYRWRPGRGAPHRLFATNDMLAGCQPLSGDLLCVRETALRPRHLVRIDLRSGRITTLFDPNPGFGSLRLGSVSRLSWTFDGGHQAFGDLVLPPDHAAGTPLPLIVVQYMSRGFLRGGTGDEYPILPLASHGFAVLSFDRPADIADDQRWTDNAKRIAANVAGWADRRHVLSALEAGIRPLIDAGIVDERRIGITGLSDGASTVQYALLHSSLFSAAAVSSCCEDPSSLDMVGEGYRDDLIRWGYVRPARDGGAFWRGYSLAMNARRVATPILMQLADDEFRMALESYEALRAERKPVDLFVFPDEHHIKWQPAHHLAIYGRAIDWFSFWLKGEPPSDPVEAARWTALRQEATAPKSAS